MKYKLYNPPNKKPPIYISLNDVDAHDGLLMKKYTVARNPSFTLYCLHYIPNTTVIQLSFANKQAKNITRRQFFFFMFQLSL